MLTCKEVTRLVASDELAGAGWSRRLAVRLHYMMCSHCRRYAAQIRRLGEWARGARFGEATGGNRIAELRRRILAEQDGTGGDRIEHK